jgi:alpha/beta superfamily hydrolase
MLEDPRAVLLDGPAGSIEALFQAPAGAPETRMAAIVAHPHPLHGGTMHNKVVHRTAKAFRAAGLLTVRFNFRGVGRSGGKYDDGRGELDDFRTVLEELSRRSPGARLVAAGFSFGSRIAILAGGSDPRVAGIFAVGVPLRLFPDLRPAIAALTLPMVILQGTRDEFTTASELKAALADVVRPPVVHPVDGDHFLTGAVDEIGRIVPWFVGRLLDDPDTIDGRDPRLC